jgi:hypothetical protein
VTTNSASYSDMLCGNLKLAIQSKRRKQVSQGVVLLHDNAGLRTAVYIVQTFQQLHEVLEHPPYSTDTTPPDNNLFESPEML